MCLLLQGNRSDQLELSYCYIKSFHDTKTHIIARHYVIERGLMAKIFFNHLDHRHLIDIMPVYPHRQN